MGGREGEGIGEKESTLRASGELERERESKLRSYGESQRERGLMS